MAVYEHRILGFFPQRQAAEIAQGKMAERGLKTGQMEIYANDQTASAPARKANSNAVLKDMLVGALKWGAVGLVLGALGEIALVVANITLFTASPWIAPLVMLGWGASLGALVGAVAGAVNPGAKKSKLGEWVCEAVTEGQVVLATTTFSEAETRTVSDVLLTAVGSFKDEAATASS